MDVRVVGWQLRWLVVVVVVVVVVVTGELPLSVDIKSQKKNHNFQCQIVIFFSHYQHLPVLQREANTNHVKPCRSLRLVAFCFVYHWVHLEYTRGECGGVQINSLHLCSFVASLELATKGHFADVHSSSKYYKKPKTYRSFTWFGFVFNKHYYFLMLRVK